VDTATRHLLLARQLAGTTRARELREAAGLSLRDVARDISSSASAVQLWETGLRRPSGDAGREYGRLLAELLRGEHLALARSLIGTDEVVRSCVATARSPGAARRISRTCAICCPAFWSPWSRRSWPRQPGQRTTAGPEGTRTLPRIRAPRRARRPRRATRGARRHEAHLRRGPGLRRPRLAGLPRRARRQAAEDPGLADRRQHGPGGDRGLVAPLARGGRGDRHGCSVGGRSDRPRRRRGRRRALRAPPERARGPPARLGARTERSSAPAARRADGGCSSPSRPR
jgi:Helix-turn-helix